jgi:hypothetical protein
MLAIKYRERRYDIGEAVKSFGMLRQSTTGNPAIQACRILINKKGDISESSRFI